MKDTECGLVAAQDGAMDVDRWQPLLLAAFRSIDMDAPLRGLGYAMS